MSSSDTTRPFQPSETVQRLDIELGWNISDRISEFWSGSTPESAMLSQPIMRNGKYLLRIRMLTPDQAHKLNDFLMELFASQSKDGKGTLDSSRSETKEK